MVYLTSVHPRYDARIFVKMCSSLAKIENYAVSLLVMSSNGDELKGDKQLRNN